MSLKKKVEKNLGYVRKQMTLFLWKYYKVRVDMRMYANKELTKQRAYSRTTFPKDRNQQIEVDIEYGLMVSGKKQKILETAFREATRIGMQRLGRPHVNGHPEFLKELEKHGLPTYGGVSEMGMELHAYQCSQCKKIYALKERKLPKTKDPTESGHLTVCCGAPFEYGGKKMYDNDTLQRIRRNLGK